MGKYSLRKSRKKNSFRIKIFRSEASKQIKKKKIKPRRLFKRLYPLTVSDVYLGKVQFLNDEKIKVKEVTPYYISSLKRVLNEDCCDEEFIQNQPDLTVGCYLEKVISGCKVKSLKSPQENYGFSLNYRVKKDEMHKEFYVSPQLAIFEGNKILYGEVAEFYDGELYTPFVKIKLRYSRKFGENERKIFDSMENAFEFEHLKWLKDSSNSIRGFFVQNVKNNYT